MSLEKITQVTGRGVYIPGDDIDTDRIIPARFMKCVTFDGLGEFAFHDVRFDPATGVRVEEHPLNQQRFEGWVKCEDLPVRHGHSRTVV